MLREVRWFRGGIAPSRIWPEDWNDTMQLTVVVLAAGLGTRYGGLKQLEPVGPAGETLMDYGIYDAARAGFDRAVLVIRPKLESAFRRRLVPMFGERIEIAFAFQRLEDLPAGLSLPPERTKPWGTGHAVLAAAGTVSSPFVVMNADDFYGRAAFAGLAAYLRDRIGGAGERDEGRSPAGQDRGDAGRGPGDGRHGTSPPTVSWPYVCASAGYTLRETLSPHGGVSRAVCETDRHGYLRRVREIKRVREDDGSIVGHTLEGQPVELTGDETISMNLWAATPPGFRILERQFAEFLERNPSDPEAEFFLSEAINEQIANGEAWVKVIPTPGPWLGVTFPEDRAYVENEIRRLIGAGDYPPDLADASQGA